MIMTGSLQGESKCSSASHEVAAHPHPRSHHRSLCIGPTCPPKGFLYSARGRQMWNNKPKGAFFFSSSSDRKSFYSKKHYHCRTAGAQLSCRCPAFGRADGQSLTTTHLMRGQNQNRTNFGSWAGRPQNSHFAGEVCYFDVLAKISLLFGNNSSWNTLFYLFLFMWVSDEHSLYSLMVCKIQYM